MRGLWGLSAAMLLLNMLCPWAKADDKLVSPPIAVDGPEKPMAEQNPELERLENRPRRSLSAWASTRRDELANTAAWDLRQDITLHKILDLPSWASLTVEERVRFEDYNTPWIKDTTQGQYSFPIQSVVWGEIRPSDTFRFGAEFWDARQYGSSDPNSLTNAMVNAGNFSQIYAAWINRDLFDIPVDAETKLGQMIISLGSSRIVGRYAFRNDQQSFVGLQQRFREKSGDWELTLFATTPEQLLPNSKQGLLHNNVVWNRPETNSIFTGGFFTRRLPERHHSELYLYYLSEPTLQPVSRVLFTPGIRFFREPTQGTWDYELETVGQTGTRSLVNNAAPSAVGAIMVHGQMGYTFDASWKPRLVAQWDFASSHFDPLYGLTVFEFGPTGILGFFARTNIMSPGFRMVFEPGQDFFMFVSHRNWWLADPASTSGWVAANLSDPSGRSGKYIGETVELSARWDAHFNLSFQAGYQVLMKGAFADNAPGAPSDHSNVNYVYVQSEFRL